MMSKQVMHGDKTVTVSAPVSNRGGTLQARGGSFAGKHGGLSGGSSARGGAGGDSGGGSHRVGSSSHPAQAAAVLPEAGITKDRFRLITDNPKAALI